MILGIAALFVLSLCATRITDTLKQKSGHSAEMAEQNQTNRASSAVYNTEAADGQKTGSAGQSQTGQNLAAQNQAEQNQAEQNLGQQNQAEQNQAEQNLAEQNQPPQNKDAENWELLLVNSTHPLSDDFTVSLTMLVNDFQADERIVDDLQDMFDTARAEGLDPHINSAYRTRQMQEEEMQEKIQAYEAEGYDEIGAAQMAAMVVAQPGTSEHETGLALDISSASQNNQAVYDWLAANAADYGFILRYPADKTDITGIDYEPWHYRYVGKAAAQEIMNAGICLEEYLGAA
ncbi:MAG: M15 family metallopeptidase [Lachnospiraceae bacterium]|nr:M15 family metallopeptidase [Lachnospiraceae bacterium]